MNTYAIMHLDRHVATIRGDGPCTVYFPRFMPFNLYLERTEAEDLSVRMNNLNNFYYWCATRLLTLDRKYAKEILNSLGMKRGKCILHVPSPRMVATCRFKCMMA